MNLKVSIVSSAYNEYENIEELINLFNRFNEKMKNCYELIIIDDGSDDGTYDIAVELSKDNQYIQILKHRLNCGKTEGIKTGIKAARSNIIAIYDTDMQYDIFDLPRLVRRIEEDNYDICTGWKSGHYKKAFVSNVYNYLSRKIFRLPIHDQNGLKVLKKEIFKDIFLRKDWHRYIVSFAIDKGYSVCEERVKLYPRKFGESKYGNPFRVFIGIFDMMTVKFIISFLKKPMIFFGATGTISMSLGFIIGFIALIMRIFFHSGFRPILYLVMLLILSGLILFTMGFIAEIIAILYEEFAELKKNRED